MKHFSPLHKLLRVKSFIIVNNGPYLLGVASIPKFALLHSTMGDMIFAVTCRMNKYLRYNRVHSLTKEVDDSEQSNKKEKQLFVLFLM